MSFRFTRLAAFVAALAITSAASAASIGINFTGSAGANGVLGTGDSAGVVAQTNYNNINGDTGTGIALNDNTGAATTATLTYTGSGSHGLYSAQGGGTTTNQPGDEALNAGFVYGSTTATFSNVPYATYDVYVYQLNDAAGRQQTTTLNGVTSYYGSAPNPGAAGFVDNNAGTAYNYIQATSSTSSTFTTDANYTLFSGVTGASFTIDVSAPGNGYLSGIQIVQQVPEPGTIALLGVGAIGLVVAARRRRNS